MMSFKLHNSALMMAGSVEPSALENKKSYFWAFGKINRLNNVVVFKYFGAKGPYKYFPFRVMLNDLN